jgi:hypothetical protein
VATFPMIDLRSSIAWLSGLGVVLKHDRRKP